MECSVKYLVRAAEGFRFFSSRNFSGGFLRGGCNLFEINLMRVILSSNDDEAVFPKIVSLVLFCWDEAELLPTARGRQASGHES